MGAALAEVIWSLTRPTLPHGPIVIPHFGVFSTQRQSMPPGVLPDLSCSAIPHARCAGDWLRHTMLTRRHSVFDCATTANCLTVLWLDGAVSRYVRNHLLGVDSP